MLIGVQNVDNRYYPRSKVDKQKKTEGNAEKAYWCAECRQQVLPKKQG